MFVNEQFASLSLRMSELLVGLDIKADLLSMLFLVELKLVLV